MSGAGGGYSGSSYGRGGAAPPPPRSFEERAQAKEQMMASVRESSQQERRVYVGNLSYDVKWHHLKDFMRQGQDAGESRCRDEVEAKLISSRIVEYATRDQAQQAVNTLSNQNLMGRLVYVREVSPLMIFASPIFRLCFPANQQRHVRIVRPNLVSQDLHRLAEDTTLVRLEAAMAEATDRAARLPEVVDVKSSSTTLVSGPWTLPYNVGWQDLKDLFRQA
ncbi:MAG: hypothetical protein Q9219_001019, partial [cf. Caloplaca sp. 3 TL-2023]